MDVQQPGTHIYHVNLNALEAVQQLGLRLESTCTLWPSHQNDLGGARHETLHKLLLHRAFPLDTTAAIFQAVKSFTNGFKLHLHSIPWQLLSHDTLHMHSTVQYGTVQYSMV